jgi:hypothetical protein
LEKLQQVTVKIMLYYMILQETDFSNED